MKTEPSSAPVALSYARSIAPTSPVSVVYEMGSPRDHQRRRDQGADAANPAKTAQVLPGNRRVVPDVVGRLAMRDLPEVLAR